MRQAGKQNHPAIMQRRIGRLLVAPVLIDFRCVRDFEGMRRWIEPHLDLVDRKNHVARDVEGHGAAFFR
jgi:hypothetical protein